MLCIVHSVDFNKWIRMCTQKYIGLAKKVCLVFPLYRKTQTNFLANPIYHTAWVPCPKNARQSTRSTSPTPVPGNHWSFHHLHNFAFSRMCYSGNYTACSLFRWGVTAHFFLALNNMLFYGDIILFIQSAIEEHLIASKFWQLWIKLI